MLYLIGGVAYTFVYAIIVALKMDETWDMDEYLPTLLLWFLTVWIWPAGLAAAAAFILVSHIKKKKNDKVSLKK